MAFLIQKKNKENFEEPDAIILIIAEHGKNQEVNILEERDCSNIILTNIRNELEKQQENAPIEVIKKIDISEYTNIDHEYK